MPEINVSLGDKIEVELIYPLLGTVTAKVEVIEVGAISVSDDPKATKVLGARVRVLAINGEELGANSHEVIVSRATLSNATQCAA